MPASKTTTYQISEVSGYQDRIDNAIVGGQNYNHLRTWTDQYIGVDNPRHKEQIRRGLNATTPSIAWKRRLNYTSITGSLGYWYMDGFTKRFREVYVYDSFWDMFAPNILSGNPPQAESADLIARQRFFSKYREARTGFQTGVFLGEVLETVNMIKNPAQSLRDGIGVYYKDVKKRLRGKNVKHHRDIIAGTWLEYAFGWAPLVNDVADAVKLADADPFRMFMPIQGTGQIDWKDEPKSVMYGTAGFYYWKRAQTENRFSVRHKGAVSAFSQPCGFPEQLGLSWSNVLPTAWELIPYSFLVDYFSNVGKIIEGVSTGQITLAWGCSTRRGWSRTKCTSFARPQDVPLPKPFGYTLSLSGEGVAAFYRDVQRTGLNVIGTGLTDLSFKLPGNFTQWINIAGLAAMRS
jgi:hypothetical protein